MLTFFVYDYQRKGLEHKAKSFSPFFIDKITY